VRSSVRIPGRFNGPPSSANGGYTAGTLAQASGLPGAVTVQLRRPPPLDLELAVEPGEDGTVELRDGEAVVAVARPAVQVPWTAWEPVAPEVAAAPEASYAGFVSHPFPTCFACGPDRRPGDGLRIFPGRIDDDRVAAAWTPDGEPDVPVTWAALDCVSAWSSDLEHRPLVLAQMTALIEAAPRSGTSYAVVGAHLRSEGRKTWTASALFDGDGRTLGRAEHLWIAVDLDRLAGDRAGHAAGAAAP
jgi:hypothetical protein